MDIYKTIKNPLSTEKAIRMMESENKLLFEVDRKATKKDVKEAIEKIFKVKIEKVNTLIGPDGKKRAYVRFSNDNPAIDTATKLGLM
ncbi:50S ribosomal protein L23 [Candidatus Woesearchaeota archaeon]|nr:50S ribosomal protein L23 [Candidatus Woesearchaeota archaeon]